LLYFEAYLLILLQRLEAVRLHFRKVCNQIFAAFIRRDEAEALCVIEPTLQYRLPSADFPRDHTFRVITPRIEQLLAGRVRLAQCDWCATIEKSAFATTMMAGGEVSKAA
jgi:hypothetical protein